MVDVKQLVAGDSRDGFVWLISRVKSWAPAGLTGQLETVSFANLVRSAVTDLGAMGHSAREQACIRAEWSKIGGGLETIYLRYRRAGRAGLIQISFAAGTKGG